MTALQEGTPADYQARITGLMESLGAAMPGVGYLLGGALVALGSPRTAFAVAGGGVLAARRSPASCCARGSTGTPASFVADARVRTEAGPRRGPRAEPRPLASGNAPDGLNLT